MVGDSEYIMIAQDKVGCLTADGNVDGVDLHRALNIIKINWPLTCRGVCRWWVMRVSEHSSTASNTP